MADLLTNLFTVPNYYAVLVGSALCTWYWWIAGSGEYTRGAK